MACKGRFVKIEGGGLPEVTNYDYPVENLYLRGVEDRSFRFQEVCSASNWLFQERTVNGDFSTITGEIFSAGLDSLTDRGISQGYYSGWVYNAGLITYDLPFSGAGHGGDYKTLGTLTGEFWGAPIRGQHSPVMVNILPDQELVLVQTGISLSGDTRHQMYGQFKCLYSQTGVRIDYTIEGYTGDNALKKNNIVAWYNPQTYAWESDQPHNTIAVKNSPTEFAVDFTTSSFPAATPTEYNLRVALTGAATYSTSDDDVAFVQVDSLHIDEYKKKNAFTDVVIPSGYMLQVTPDLGWHDTLAMFGERTSSPNPHLVTLGPFTLSSGLVDNMDTSATITVSADEMERATSNNYRKYLWRVLGVSENGTIGAGGFPRKFRYMGRIFDEEFSVDKVWDDHLSITKLITGTKSRRMSVIVDNIENHPGLEYPTDTSWKLTIVMDVPTKDVAIKGKDKGGALTSERFITLTSETVGMAQKSLWNVFDEYGLLLGVERLPDESNESYAERMQDAFLHPGTHFFDGVVDGGTRELGLDKLKDCLILKHAATTNQNIQSLSVEVTSSAVLVRTLDLVHTETVMVDPVYLTSDLTYHLADTPSHIETIEGTRVNLDQVTIADEDDERPDFRRIQFTDDSLGGKLIRVTYAYFRDYKFVDYPTLGSLVTTLKGFTDKVGVVSLEVTTDKRVAGHESSYGLYIDDGTIPPGGILGLSWSPMHLKKVGDRVYRESFRNVDGTLWNTKFYKWIQELKSNTNTEWGHVIADKAVWDAADNTLDGYDHLATLTDPAIFHYNTTGGRSIDPEEAQARNYRDEDGKVLASRLLVHDDFLPGVAHTHDLQPTIFATLSSSPEIAEAPDVLVGETGNVPIKFFSGTIN